MSTAFKYNIISLSDIDIPNDCTSLHNMNCGLPSGLYTIKIPFLNHVTVFCDMEKDGGGWTVRTFYIFLYIPNAKILKTDDII